MQRLLITGANGFLGNALCVEAHARGYSVRGVTRSAYDWRVGSTSLGIENITIDDFKTSLDWQRMVLDCDIVVHLAARVHIMRENLKDPLAEFRLINTEATEKLARCAALSGVRRFVFISTIGVNGLYTEDNVQFLESDSANPHNAYALSKWEAEQALHRVATETGLEVVILRPPLVYGARAPGNFAQMLRLVELGIPLPLAGIKNKRDLIYVGNLVDAILTCARHSSAAGETYLVSDGETVSTTEILIELAKVLGVSSRVFLCPISLLKLIATLFGKSGQFERLIGSLQIDSTKIRRELGWKPPYSLRQGLCETVRNNKTV